MSDFDTFKADPPSFMKNHAIHIFAGSATKTIGLDGFTKSPGSNTKISMAAPTAMGANFRISTPKTHHPQLTCGVDLLRLELTTEDENGFDAPVYIIPYTENFGIGTQLAGKTLGIWGYGKIGKLDELMLDPKSWATTHIQMREGHLWGRRT